MAEIVALTIPSLRTGIVFVVVLVILGVLYRMLEPMVAESFRTPIRLVVLLLLVVAVLGLFGLF